MGIVRIVSRIFKHGRKRINNILRPRPVEYACKVSRLLRLGKTTPERVRLFATIFNCYDIMRNWWGYRIAFLSRLFILLHMRNRMLRNNRRQPQIEETMEIDDLSRAPSMDIMPDIFTLPNIDTRSANRHDCNSNLEIKLSQPYFSMITPAGYRTQHDVSVPAYAEDEKNRIRLEFCAPSIVTIEIRGELLGLHSQPNEHVGFLNHQQIQTDIEDNVAQHGYWLRPRPIRRPVDKYGQTNVPPKRRRPLRKTRNLGKRKTRLQKNSNEKRRACKRKIARKDIKFGDAKSKVGNVKKRFFKASL